MRQSETLLSRARPALFAAACLALALYFGFHAFEGGNGLKALRQAQGQEILVQKQAIAAAEERQRLETRLELLDPQRADSDYVDELVRRDLGFVDPNELIVPLPENK